MRRGFTPVLAAVLGCGAFFIGMVGRCCPQARRLRRYPRCRQYASGPSCAGPTPAGPRGRNGPGAGRNVQCLPSADFRGGLRAVLGRLT